MDVKLVPSDGESVDSAEQPDAATTKPAVVSVVPEPGAYEIRKLELEFADKRDQRHSDLIKWFIAAVWPAILSLLTTWSQHSAIDTAKTEINKNVAVVEDKANAAAASADTAAKKATVAANTAASADKTATDTNAVTAKLLATVTADPDDMARAEEAKTRSDNKPMPPLPRPDQDEPPKPPAKTDSKAAAANYDVIRLWRQRQQHKAVAVDGHPPLPDNHSLPHQMFSQGSGLDGDDQPQASQGRHASGQTTAQAANRTARP
jgi:hypothetical protein